VNEREAWLDRRVPAPPVELRRAVLAALESDDDGEPLGPSLAKAGRARLAAALARPGRVRASAFEMLAADALITYACEAALSSDDPEGSLLAIVEAAVAP
jgi:hypothetical protein